MGGYAAYVGPLHRQRRRLLAIGVASSAPMLTSDGRA